jgi:4-hydroxybenzoyl-CoA reductase subunit beta
MTISLAQLRLYSPANLPDALATARNNPGSRYIAGGTDLLVNMRRNVTAAGMLIDLSSIGELHDVVETGSGLLIGSMVTLAELAQHERIAADYTAVSEAARAVAAPGHRTLATVGGNLCLDTRCIYYNQSEWWRNANGYCLKAHGDICHVAPQGQRCHAAFSGDLAPALLVFDAQIEIAGSHGRRRIPLSALYVEDGRAHLTLKPDEIVTAVHLRPLRTRSGYAKIRQRGAIDFPLAGVAVALSRNGPLIASLRIALTGTNSRPLLLAGTDAFQGRALDDKLLQDLDRAVQKQVQPMRTTLISSNYRRVAAAAMAKRLVSKLFADGA